MKFVVFTICLNGMPFIKKHISILKKTNLDWRWIVVEGAAQNNGSTAWCKPQAPRLSDDGTSQYLKSITDSRVTLIQRPDWSSKDTMCQVALEQVTEPCVLFQIDGDEIWDSEQLGQIFDIFCSDPILQMMKFACRYFVGNNLILEGEHCYGDNDYEWNRAWKFTPGMKWKSHEPPIMEHPITYFMDKDETRRLGLVFDHFAYATEAQVKYKEAFYSYPGLLDQWRALQNYTEFPVSLSKFFSHVPQGEWPKVVRI